MANMCVKNLTDSNKRCRNTKLPESGKTKRISSPLNAHYHLKEIIPLQNPRFYLECVLPGQNDLNHQYIETKNAGVSEPLNGSKVHLEFQNLQQ